MDPTATALVLDGDDDDDDPITVVGTEILGEEPTISQRHEGGTVGTRGGDMMCRMGGW
jgi:hypothetical protein